MSKRKPKNQSVKVSSVDDEIEVYGDKKVQEMTKDEKFMANLKWYFHYCMVVSVIYFFKADDSHIDIIGLLLMPLQISAALFVFDLFFSAWEKIAVKYNLWKIPNK